MAEVQKVTNYQYAHRTLNFYCIVDDSGIPIFAPSMFLFHLAKKGKSSRTVRGYAFDLEKFFTVLEESKLADGGFGIDYREVSDKQMSGYLNGYLKQICQLKDKTIDRHIAALSGFYKYTYKQGLLSEKTNYTFTYGEEEVKVSALQGLTTALHETYFNESEFKSVLLANIDTDDPFYKERDKLALMLGYHAGFRTEELIIESNLDVAKLKKLLPYQKVRVPKAITLPILGKGGKTREAQLTVAGTTAIYNFLWGRAKNVKTNLMCSKVGKPLIYTGHGTELFRDCIKSYYAKVRISEDERKQWAARKYHTLRKCYATNMVEYCIDLGLDPKVWVTQWMGHEDPDTTDIYIFYDAVLNKRQNTLNDLNLQKSAFASLYKNKYKLRSKNESQ